MLGLLGVSLSALQPRIVADAFDTLVLAGQPEILRKFEELESESGRSIIFNAEVACFPNRDSICEKTPAAKHRWRYLNAGLMVGRVQAFKRILPEPLQGEEKEVNDQWWWQIYRRDHPENILLDTECKLLCNLFAVTEEDRNNSRAPICMSSFSFLPILQS